MNFDLSEDQTSLKDSVERLIAREYGPEARSGYMKSLQGWSRHVWQQYAEIGLHGMPFSEEDGGFGGTAADLMLVMHSLGKGLVLEPFVSTVVLCGTAIRLGANVAQRERYLAPLIDGASILALAHGETGSRSSDFKVGTAATVDSSGGWRLHGRKSLVLHGDSAEVLLVTAKKQSGGAESDQVAIFMVPADAPGVTRLGYKLIDGSRAADIVFDNVLVPGQAMLDGATSASAVVAQAYDAATFAMCAEAVGAMESLHAMTVEYLKTRKQFGVPIGNFQVLQHRAVDMLIALEQARSIVLYAAMMADQGSSAEFAKAVSAAKVLIQRSGRFIAHESIQLHGGIGMTWELQVGQYARRLQTIEALFGDASHHLARLTELGGLVQLDDLDAPIPAT